MAKQQVGGNIVSQQTVLLIDDDKILLELLSDHIRSAEYRCLTANGGLTGLEIVRVENPDLIVLDVMMPEMDGWDVCQQIRHESQIPIIMLTAKDEEIDKLRGFRLGVDDYVTKPFSFAELVARIGAVLARSQIKHEQPRQIVSGNLVLDFDRRYVTLSGQLIDLTPTEYRLLETLAKYSDRTVPTEQLLDAVWGPAYYGQIDQVKHYVWSLRKKIERDPGDPEHIITERGFGYRFE